ncbi:MAG: response regulator transcription factor [Geobacteraceae bacterium]|nr:response regulator transcription factor [Geobacteraceae bacterium]
MNIMIHLNSRLLRAALSELLLREPEGFRVFTEEENMANADHIPDFVLVDNFSLRRGVPDRARECKVVLIDYGLAEEEITSLLLCHKIDGVLSTTSDVTLLKKGLHAIREGQIWIDNRKVKALIQHAESSRGAGAEEGFSKKEREIIILIAQGLINREIAARLCISEQTVKTHIGRIFRKANVSRRSQLVPMALKLRAPDPP